MTTDQLTICYRSLADKRHSQDIARNPQVTGLMVHDHAPTETPVRSVRFVGAAALLETPRQREPYAELFADKFSGERSPDAYAADILQKAANGDSQFYEIDVAKFEYYGPSPEGDGSGKSQTFVLPREAILG